MKISYKNEYTYNSIHTELARYVENEVTDRGTHGSGQLEDMQGSIGNLCAAFGRLVETLVERKVLNLDDVAPIVSSSDTLEKVP